MLGEADVCTGLECFPVVSGDDRSGEDALVEADAQHASLCASALRTEATAAAPLSLCARSERLRISHLPRINA
jgi:hypothetical protein